MQEGYLLGTTEDQGTVATLNGLTAEPGSMIRVPGVPLLRQVQWAERPEIGLIKGGPALQYK